MRSVLPALVAGSALVLTAACGNNAAAPAAAPASTPTIAASTPTPAAPMPAELTKANFGPKVMAALRAAGTFQATAELTDDERGPSPRVTAAIRLRGATPDAVVTSEDSLPVTRIGKVLYMKNDELTGNPKKPWVRLDLGSNDPEVLIAAVVVVQDLNRAMVHQVIGGTAYATSFKAGGVQSLDGTQVREYVVSIDVKKATAARALGVYLDRTDAKTLPAQLSVSIMVDAQNRPRRMSFVLADTKDGSTAVRAWFERFGAKLPIVAPPAAQTGKLDLS
ncbi:hypothetical protein ACQPXM_19055 [Kribbella sp. CA-253562]|uniref:hypothetical protein n=1 Tax=Kribbella sp. CA-253562 TaxID=3239942 RepID=UPI003D938EF1